jgi:hypothetical protein
MPELSIYSYTDPGAIDTAARAEERKRQQQIARLQRYYDGDMKRPLKVKAGEPDDNVILELCRKVVNQSASMLFGNVPEFELDETSETPEEQALASEWARNGAATMLIETARGGSIAGHCFWKIWPVETGDGTQVRIVNLDPVYVTAFWRPEDKSDVVCYKISWQDASQNTYRQDIVRASIVDGPIPWPEGMTTVANDAWLIRDLYRDAQSTEWRELGMEVWEHPFAPMLDWQNLPRQKGYYGQTDLVNPELNDSVNFLASNIMRIIKYHGHPKTIGTGMQASELQDTAVDAFWVVANTEARVYNLEMQSDLTASREMYHQLKWEFYSEHQAVDMMVLHSQEGISRITNFGLRSLFKDAMDKLALKRRQYGEALQEASRRILYFLKIEPRAPTLHWGDPLPLNGLEEVQEIQLEMGLGILSKQTASRMRGRDWEVERQRIAAERAMEQEAGVGALDAIIRRGFQTPLGGV